MEMFPEPIFDYRIQHHEFAERNATRRLDHVITPWAQGYGLGVQMPQCAGQ